MRLQDAPLPDWLLTLFWRDPQTLENEHVTRINEQRQVPDFRSGDILEVQVVSVQRPLLLDRNASP